MLHLPGAGRLDQLCHFVSTYGQVDGFANSPSHYKVDDFAKITTAPREGCPKQ
jgi:hypothetical protein